MQNFAVIVLSLSTLLISHGLKAETGGRSASSTIVKKEAVKSELGKVLFLEIAAENEDRVREQSFVADLKMSLDNLQVQAVPVKEPGFSQLTVGKQIFKVRILIEQHGAVAVIWLAKSPPNLLMLHVVVVSEGRALVRLVETDEQEASESDLASAARELLGTSHLFSIPKPKWFVFADVRSTGGLVGNKGPWLWIGGDAGLERHLVAGLYTQFWIGVFGGPIGHADDLTARGWALAPGIGMSYLWDVGPVELGPRLGLRSWWSSVGLRAGQGAKERSMEWQAQVLANLELRVHLTDRLELTMGGGISATPHRDTYDRTSDDTTVYATPFISWDALIGIVLQMDSSR